LLSRHLGDSLGLITVYTVIRGFPGNVLGNLVWPVLCALGKIGLGDRLTGVLLTLSPLAGWA